MPQVAFIDYDLRVHTGEMTVLELIEKVKAQEQQLRDQEQRILDLETMVSALY